MFRIFTVIAVFILKFEHYGFNHTAMHPTDVERMGNSEDPDQTAPSV